MNPAIAAALPFLLDVPVPTYRGDIGDERRGFEIAREVPGLRPWQRATARCGRRA